jgi:hypothetical protein
MVVLFSDRDEEDTAGHEDKIAKEEGNVQSERAGVLK